MTLLRLLLVILVLQTRGQAPQAPAARATISGVVVRAGAAAGLQFMANVVMELRPAGVFATTNPKGVFTFRNVAPGFYMLIPRKDGFVPQKDTARGVSDLGMAIKVDGGQARTDIEIPMIPAPTISGFVYHPNGEPVAAGVVQAHARRYTPFGPVVRVAKRVLTNDLGEYRLYWLSFGQFIVGASYGERVRNSALGGTRLSANVSKADDGYATVFYGATTNPGDAQTIRLAPGIDAGTANIVLTDVRRVKVRGQLVPPVGGVRIAFVPQGSDISSTDYSISSGSGGNFEIAGVAPGAYVLLAEGSGMSSDIVRLNVGNDDIDKLRIPLYPTITVGGGFIGIRPQDAELHVQFIRRSLEIDQKFETILQPTGRFTLDVAVGHYDLFIEGLPPNRSIKSVMYGGTDVLPDGFTITGDPAGDFIIWVQGTTDVEGRIVNNGGRQSGGAQVVLVPESMYRQRPDRYVVGYTDAGGEFQLNAVPPGRYTAYAFEQIEEGAYFAFAYSSQPFLRFAPYGVQVIVSEKTPTRNVGLRLVPATETAGGFQ